jgi:hypothetical protein
MDGYLLFYEGEIKDGTGSVAGKRLFSFYLTDGEVKSISPAIIWDLKEEENADKSPVDIEGLKNRTLSHVIQQLERYKEELLVERKRQADIKQKYGIKSLDHLILSLDGDLISLDERKNQGENVDLVIRNKEERKSEYERALIELKEQIEKEKSLTMSMPSFVGIIRIQPAAIVDSSMQSDEEIERIGMQVAMKYERKQGRIPEDVSSENLGFDIRSTDKEGNKRYIEVKARAGTGAVALTQNEWFIANRFKEDYFLYVVMNATSIQQLIIIQNPAERLQPEERVEVVRFIFSKEEITEKGVFV